MEARTWRYSTEDEINHLDACIIAGKYVDKPLKEVVEKEASEFLTELGDEWYSLVGYTLVTEFGEKFEIIKHFQSGRCNCKNSNRTFDVHNIDAPYDMEYKSARVLAKKPVTKEYTYKEGDEVSCKIYPGKKFIVRGYSENFKLYLISSEDFSGHNGRSYPITWGAPVKDKNNWWASEGYLSPWVEEDSNVFPAGSYVVLLASCDVGVKWKGIPINHCYKLEQESNSNHFFINKDTEGSISNGWYHTPYDSKLKLRAATPEEIAEYKKLGKPFDVTTLEETFQIGRWYQNKNESRLFIKPIGIKSEDFKVDVIWSNGTYGDSYLSKNDFKGWNLVDDLSIIQEFLPDGHPDKVVVEKTPKPKSLVGRYVKVLNARFRKHYGIKNGDYLLFDKVENGTYEYWGEYNVKHYHGTDVHKDPDFELMPEGFHPIDALIDTPTNIHTELKVNTWYKYKRYSSEKWVYILVDHVKQVDTCKEVYYTQKIVDGKLVHESSSIMGTALDERLIEVDASEIHLIISHNQYPLTPKETHSSWLNAQEEYHRQQYRYNLVMNERESLIRDSIPAYTHPLSPQECYKPCESKEDIISSHLILLDVKPVRVSKQFK
jgi:hypothetical protein